MQLMRCLGSNDEVGLIVFEKNLSISNAIDGTKLRKLEKEVGEVNTITAICYLLNRFNANFNVGKSLTTQQSATLASDIVEKYPYETIEDIVLMLKQVRQGIIGDGKDFKLDGQNVLAKWMPDYLDRKYAEVERQNQKKNEVLPYENNAVEQFYAKMRSKKAKEEKDERIKSQIDEMAKSMIREQLEETITEWSQKEDMKPYLDYLKRKRLVIK
jgi:DNA replicative helicase MCM subunit Mcm2 (Cdc46/Mcm family)